MRLLHPFLLLAAVIAAHDEGNYSLHWLPSLPLLSPRGRGGGRGVRSKAQSDVRDDQLARLSLLVLGCIVAFMLVWRTVIRFSNHIRRLTNLSNNSQRYFISPNPYWAWLKQSVVYAPLFRTRHNREFRLSSALNMGTLPTRFQATLLLGILGMNLTLCCVTIPFLGPEKLVLQMIRTRTGTMAVVNLVPLVVMAGRNNPLIKLLNVSFDTWNLLHRWFGRIVVLESVAHVVVWMAFEVHTQGWASVVASFERQYMLAGLVSSIGFVMLALHSFSALRHAFYETFLHLHIFFVILALGFLWVHVRHYPQLKFLLTAIIAWSLERVFRLARLTCRNFGKGGTSMTVEVLPGDAMRITLNVARPWIFKPGQHLYLYVPSAGLWMSHPFTVAWSDVEEEITDEKGIVMSRQDVLALQRTKFCLVVRRRTGFTNKLYERASQGVEKQITLQAFVEGPYGNEHVLDSYGTVLMFAAGVGITHHISFVRHLVAGYAQGTVAARRITLVWVIQSPEHLEWVRPWMTNILAMERRREIFRAMLFVTRPRNTKEIRSPSATVQMFSGKPHIQTVIDREVETQIGAMAVMVCGTGSLSDDVRRACRQRQAVSNIDFIEESFSW